MPSTVEKATKLTAVAITDDGGLGDTAAYVAVKVQVIMDRSDRTTRY